MFSDTEQQATGDLISKKKLTVVSSMVIPPVKKTQSSYKHPEHQHSLALSELRRDRHFGSIERLEIVRQRFIEIGVT